jgi:glycosyltransferase involved in cell wall biosynthesis
MQRIDYIIPTWNSEDTLRLTLESIDKYGNPNQKIIVDRYSDDDTLIIAQEFNCKILSTDANLGASRRIGAKEARTELIAFIDSDVEITEDWINLIRCAQDNKYPDAGVIGSYNDNEGIKIDRLLELKGGNGAFGCCITHKNLILECEDLDNYSSAEDRFYASFLYNEKGLKWYVLPYPVLHHQNINKIPRYLRFRWLGAGLRKKDSFHFLYIMRMLGGALIGIRYGRQISYLTNFSERVNYCIGYVMYKKYYEIDRSNLH